MTRFALVAAALALLGLAGCTEQFFGRTWPDEPDKTAVPTVEKPCTVIHNKDGTTGTSC